MRCVMGTVPEALAVEDNRCRLPAPAKART